MITFERPTYCTLHLTQGIVQPPSLKSKFLSLSYISTCRNFKQIFKSLNIPRHCTPRPFSPYDCFKKTILCTAPSTLQSRSPCPYVSAFELIFSFLFFSWRQTSSWFSLDTPCAYLRAGTCFSKRFVILPVAIVAIKSRKTASRSSLTSITVSMVRTLVMLVKNKVPKVNIKRLLLRGTRSLQYFLKAYRMKTVRHVYRLSKCLVYSLAEDSFSQRWSRLGQKFTLFW